MNRLNIIHDPRMAERYNPLMQELKEQGITVYKLWPPVEDVNSVVRSINLSHKQIVRDAAEKGLEYVIVGEDDLAFPAKDGWRYFLANMPEVFDVYAASTYVQDLEDKNILCGFHLYAVSHQFYQAFLSIDENKHIDTACGDLKGNFQVCHPFAALQRPCWSANARAEVNYNQILNENDIYRGALHYL